MTVPGIHYHDEGEDIDEVLGVLVVQVVLEGEILQGKKQNLMQLGARTRMDFLGENSMYIHVFFPSCIYAYK